MNKVYLLWHIHEFEDEDQDDSEKLIGAYASESDAMAAIDRLKD